MENALPKIKQGVTSAPLAALLGALTGVLVARQVGYQKTITVVPFIVVGAILGFTIARHL